MNSKSFAERGYFEVNRVKRAFQDALCKGKKELECFDLAMGELGTLVQAVH